MALNALGANKKLLVTGGAGYIGSLLVPALLGQGYEVRVLDNFYYRQNALLDCCFYPGLTLVRGDVRDQPLVRKMMEDVDYILPLACLTGAPLCEKNPWEAQTVNFDAVHFILKNRKSGQKIIFPTTNSGYGRGGPSRENLCTEESPLLPVSLYGVLKVEIEKMVLAAGDAITLRLATVFGAAPRMRLDLLVNDFVYRAVTDKSLVLFEGHFKRNYLHIRDAVGAFLHCLLHFEGMKDQTYNVGLDEANLTKKDLCLKIQEHVPDFQFFQTNIGKDPDQRDYLVSNEKLKAKGFSAGTGLDEGIRELLRAYSIIKDGQYRNC